MKNNLLLFTGLLLCLNLSAQQIQTTDLDSAVAHIIAPLDQSEITTDLLLDKAFIAADVAAFNGTASSDTIKDYAHWYALYGTLGSAALDSNNLVIPHPESWESTAESFKNSGLC